jgi:biopolymer transport protein ExbD/biopolymer transport protein TolR
MNAEINVTSLIDVAFTLLVIFIITAPILQGGVEVRLPRAQVRAITSQEAPFIVTILADGTVVVGETPISVEEFDEIYPQLFAIADPATVVIRGDSDAIWGLLLPVAATVFRIGAENGVTVSFAADPLPEGRR